jgi:hypothetical protein
MFKGFDKRLKRDVQRLVDARLKESEEISKHKVRIYLLIFCWIILFVYSLNRLMLKS